MAEPYRLVVNRQLNEELEGLKDAAERDPQGPEAKEYRAALRSLKVIRDGKEADHDGKRLNPLVDKYGDLSDCAEIKVDVFEEYAPNGHKFGPSHRLTYREFEGTSYDPRPIREAVAFGRRKDGEAFVATGSNLSRGLSVTLPEIAEAKVVSKSEPHAPIRMPLPAHIAEQLKEGHTEAFKAAQLARMGFARPARDAVVKTPSDTGRESSRTGAFDAARRRSQLTGKPANGIALNSAELNGPQANQPGRQSPRRE